MPSSSRILDAETAADRSRGYEDAAGAGLRRGFSARIVPKRDRVEAKVELRMFAEVL